MKMQLIDHIVIIVKDVKRTTDFYSVFLGEPESIDEEQVSFVVGDTKLFFGLYFDSYQPANKDHYGMNHIAFRLTSVEELSEIETVLNTASIAHSGVQIDKYSNKEFIWLDDPDGYRIEFYLRN